MNVITRSGLVLSCAAVLFACDRMGAPKDRPGDTTTTGATTAVARNTDQLDRMANEKKLIDEPFTGPTVTSRRASKNTPRT